jgi:glutaminyl-tRNA synthetase
MENENIESAKKRHFINDIIDEDNNNGYFNGKVITRFPPEPNGYLHIGHAKSICLNFGIALEYHSRCHLRFDDTNPSKEEQEYIDSIIEDVKWLGFDWGEHLYYASDYFDKMYNYAIELIKKGKAYVCSLKPDEIKDYRGTLTSPGVNSPYRTRSVEENLELFDKMKNGDFNEGEAVLRAKIDMASPNLNMRDPVIYRIKKESHPRSGNKWVIYPMYDFAHCLSDSIEQITHSICTLEFEDHRPLYDWFLDELNIYHPKQIEFARLNISYTVLSKRKLLLLVQKKYVQGWDDPRMPTLSGLRRRGFTPASIRDFCSRIGVAKSDNIVDIALLEHCIREDLNKTANRVMAVLKPLKVIITNYPEDKVEELEADNHPGDESFGKRMVPFSREIYIEADDFTENPPRKWFRLSPGKEIRLKHAYYITCENVIKDEAGNVIEVHCKYDPASKGGWTEDARKVRGTSHWVSAKHCLPAEIRLYNNFFTKSNPDAENNFEECINPDSLEILSDALVEPALKNVSAEDKFQFLRQGYFNVDFDSSQDKLVFNRIVPLRDTWAKLAKK